MIKVSISLSENATKYSWALKFLFITFDELFSAYPSSHFIIIIASSFNFLFVFAYFIDYVLKLKCIVIAINFQCWCETAKKSLQQSAGGRFSLLHVNSCTFCDAFRAFADDLINKYLINSCTSSWASAVHNFHKFWICCREKINQSNF